MNTQQDKNNAANEADIPKKLTYPQEWIDEAKADAKEATKALGSGLTKAQRQAYSDLFIKHALTERALSANLETLKVYSCRVLQLVTKVNCLILSAPAIEPIDLTVPYNPF